MPRKVHSPSVQTVGAWSTPCDQPQSRPGKRTSHMPHRGAIARTPAPVMARLTWNWSAISRSFSSNLRLSRIPSGEHARGIPDAHDSRVHLSVNRCDTEPWLAGNTKTTQRHHRPKPEIVTQDASVLASQRNHVSRIAEAPPDPAIKEARSSRGARESKVSWPGHGSCMLHHCLRSFSILTSPHRPLRQGPPVQWLRYPLALGAAANPAAPDSGEARARDHESKLWTQATGMAWTVRQGRTGLSPRLDLGYKFVP